MALIAALLCGLFAVRAPAMEVPDSLGLVRLATVAGRSGDARMRVQRDSAWVVYSRVKFDALGLHTSAPAQTVAPVTSTWAESTPDTDIAWSSITRLQVPRPHGHWRAPVIGAVIGGLVSLPVIAGWPEGEVMKPADAVGAFAMFTVLGALAGKGLSVINPWKGHDWVEFP